MSSAKRDTFTSYFPILIPLIYSSYLMVQANIFSEMLKRNDSSRHHYLVPIVRGKAFSFLPTI